MDQQKAMDLVTCCIVLCSVDNTFTVVCILLKCFFVTKMFIYMYLTLQIKVNNILHSYTYVCSYGG